MAEPVTDRHVVAVLRPFVRATAPMLDAVRLADFTGDRSVAEPARNRLHRVRFPGTAAWSAMTVAERDHWWVNRVGRLTVLLASIPGLGGALADRLPIQDTLATAGQGLVLCALAGEHGIIDHGERVRLIAWVLFKRDIHPAVAAGDARTRAQEDAATAELAADVDSSGRITAKAAAKALWRFGRVLWALGDELDKRPQGRIHHKALGLLPVVGAAGDYLGERSALKRAARAGQKWLAGNQ